jgi:hypothetical protein
VDLLARYRDEFSRNLEKAGKLATGLTDEQFCWRPAPGAWSACENLLHLIATGRLYVPAIEKSVQQARTSESGTPGEFRYSLFERLFIWMMEPPVRLKMKAPKHFTPAGVMPKGEVLREFGSMNASWVALLDAVRGMDLKRIKVTSPVNARFKFSLGATFAINAAHERRHLWQAGQVIRHPLFPRGS